MNRKLASSGFIKWIILIIIAILVLSYFGFDLKGLLEDEQTQGNTKAVFVFLGKIWTNYLKAPVVYVWDEIIIGFVWEDILYPLIFEDREVLPEAPESPEIGLFKVDWAQVS